ncbi:extracellular solute-binding protein [Stappia sp. GBMRC 2046]|uniref:Extracellular solute-binding protein n=2 Tax=Stappia sediminis TaxID=2692190 RepID=A0A7X3LY03_9HYPH|nr:extracellular solute-binding protein [Stappia sediminis]
MAGFICGTVFIADANAADLTVVTWGGTYARSQQEAYGKPFEEKTGKTIRWVNYNGGLADIRAQVKSGDVIWDVVDVFPSDARKGCAEGLFEKLPEEVVTAPDESGTAEGDLIVPRPNDCVSPNIIWSWVTFYERGKFGDEGPKTISDFFDLERFPGKRGLSVFAQSNLEMALVADGVAPGDVYDVLSTDEGLDRAFAKLESLGDQVVFWSAGTEPLELVNSGKAAVSTGYNGRVSEAILAHGADYEIVWDGQLLEEEWFAIVKGAPNREAAFEFLKISTTPQAQAEQARWIPYGPMRRSALKIIRENEPWFHSGQTVMEHMPDREEVMARTIIANPDWWAENGTDASERYKAWMESR